MAAAREPTPLLVVFMDLTRWNAEAFKRDEAVLADTIDAYYERVGAAVKSAGGTLVKFIGDAALAVFPESACDAAVAALLDLKDQVDGMMEDLGWECRLSVKVHFGTVMAGPFGVRGEKRFDIIGPVVNTTARLDSRGVTLSADAFRALDKATRTRFKKHTPPVTYIRAEDPRPKRKATVSAA